MAGSRGGAGFQRCDGENAGGPELIGRLQQRLSGLRELVRFPRSIGEDVASMQGKKAWATLRSAGAS